LIDVDIDITNNLCRPIYAGKHIKWLIFSRPY